MMKIFRLAAIVMGAAIVSVLSGTPPSFQLDVLADEAPWGYNHPLDTRGHATFLRNLTSATVNADPDTTCLITVHGDANNSGTVTSADIITLVSYCFRSGPVPLPCEAAGDVNCNGAVTAADIIVEVNYCFKGGAPPCAICTSSPLRLSCN